MAADEAVLAPGRKALECVDRVLAEQPSKDGQALTEATKQLCLFREVLAPAARGGGEEARRRLEIANGVLSVVTAVHFPLGPTPWDELTQARSWLANLLAPPQDKASSG